MRVGDLQRLAGRSRHQLGILVAGLAGSRIGVARIDDHRSRLSAIGLQCRAVELDWRRSEGEEWTIAVETSDGTSVRLEGGGATLILNGQTTADSGIGEYPDIYRTFVDLIDQRQSLVDVAPLRLVADTLLLAGRKTVEAVQS